MPLDPRSRIRDIVSKMFGAETACAPVNMPGIGRLVIVSNRVATVAQMKTNPGGLAVAMAAALREHPALWFGSSGEFTDGPVEAPKISQEGPLIRALLDLPRTDYNRYYAGFSNGALWPLFHYRVGVVNFSHEDYAAYQRINEEFARHLVPLLQPDDVIWIHDYQMIPLAGMLRARGVTQKIGFFLHIPFPAPEVLTTLPVHEEIVRGLAQYDLVGFQTQTDQTAFTDYIQRERREQVYGEGWVQAFGRRFRVGAFPIAIDAEIVNERARRMAAGVRNRQLKDSLSGRKLMIGVDRLDYTKGLDRRFQAIEHLFEDREEHRRGVVMLQIAPPTRGDVPEYRRVRAELNALIGHINGKFGDADLLPIRYLNRQFSQDILFGYFRLSCAALVTPLRDGMNLVAKEFVACQDPDDPGIPILSRFAGAAQQMDAAVIVNPFDVRGMATALHQVLTMPVEERRDRHRSLALGLRNYDIHRWRDTFLSELTRSYEDVVPEHSGETADLFSLADIHH
jgi:trehalose 6-phosphate synthase